MSPIREQLVGVIDCLPETEQSLLLEIARRFLPDDTAAPDDLEAIQKARVEYARGQTPRPMRNPGAKASTSLSTGRLTTRWNGMWKEVNRNDRERAQGRTAGHSL